MEAMFLVMSFVLGTCLGSFLCCQVRRLHHRSRKGSKPLGSRSICLHCHAQLKWYDNIPLVSWLFLRGKCRKCHKPIGVAEILSELGTGLALLAVTAAFFRSAALPGSTPFGIFPSQGLTGGVWNIGALNLAIFIIILVLVLTLVFLAIYDGLYGQLPTKCLIISILLALVILSLRQISIASVTGFSTDLILQPLGAALVLGGLYLVLYLVSQGKWVGDGDWLLALSLALALGNVWLAFVTLFLANLFASLYALPAIKNHPKIHFGPFLVLAFIIVLAFASDIHQLLSL